MMSPETRRFYTAYRLQTSLIPVYVLTALFYCAGWYLNPLRPHGPADFAFYGVVLFAGISRLAGWLGFLLSRVPRNVVEPSEAQRTKLAAALQAQQNPAELRLIGIGHVPFLAAGGSFRPTVWISTHTLERMDADALGCLLAHELAHLRRMGGCAVQDLLWLLPWPLGWLLAAQPLLYAVCAVVQAWAWLRLQGWIYFNAERECDLAAVAQCGREQYARAMLRHLVEFETVPSSPLRRRRLAALNYSDEEIRKLLQDMPAADLFQN